VILQIGSFVLPVAAGLELQQNYEQIGGQGILRAVSGRGIKQRTFSKLRVRTSGSGWMPSGLEEIDEDAQHVMKCIAPRRMRANFTTRQATLPAGRRSDSGFTPFAFAELSGGRLVDCAVSLAGDVATAAAVSGAVAYHIHYYPQLTVFILSPTTSGNAGDASYSWELIAEEV
jgi:hypothetical protein